MNIRHLINEGVLEEHPAGQGYLMSELLFSLAILLNREKIFFPDVDQKENEREALYDAIWKECDTVGEIELNRLYCGPLWLSFCAEVAVATSL